MTRVRGAGKDGKGKGKEPEEASQSSASWQQASSASASHQGAGERAGKDTGEEEREPATKTGRSPDEMLQVPRCARNRALSTQMRVRGNAAACPVLVSRVRGQL